MSHSSEFNVPVQNSDTSNFVPITKLPEHLDQYLKIGTDLREKMNPVMKTLLDLTDKMVLRSAALPQNN